VLDEIALRYERQVKLESLWRKLRSANDRKADVKLARKFIRMITNYEKILFVPLWPYSNIHRELNLVIKVLKDLNRNGPPWMMKPRGAPVKEEFCVTVRNLWGSITALLKAAFPDWFKRDKNSIRNVKNAYREAGQFLKEGEQVF